MRKLHGIITVTVTPFTQDGSLDYDSAAKHIDWLIGSGVHGLLPLGATGEFSALTMQERKAYAEFFMKYVNGRVPVAIGVVSMNFAETLELMAHAAAIKADAVMALPSPGLHLSQSEIIGFYSAISKHATLPVMVYNNPGSCGVDILPETLERIATLPHMNYLKESTGDIKRLTGSVDALGKKLTVLCGCENLAYESFVMGAEGWICVAGNVAPAMTVELYDLIVHKHDFTAAREVYRKLLPLLRLIEETGELWQVVKSVSEKQGMVSGFVRPPRGPLSEGVRARLDALMKQVTYR